MALAHDLTQAARMARRHRGFSAVVVAVLALAIGLDTVVFGLVESLLLRPAPVVEPTRLVHVYATVPGDPTRHAPMAFPDYESLREGTAAFAGVAAHAWFPLALDRGDGSELILGEAVTGNYFDVLGVTPARGRALAEGDDERGSPGQVVVLSDDGWRRHFGAAVDVVGRELLLNGRPFVVVGVAPRGFRGLTAGLSPDLWLPLHAAVELPTGVTINLGTATPGLSRLADRGQRWLWVTGRLRAGATQPQARAEVVALAAELARVHPASNQRRAFVAVPSDAVHVLPGLDRALWTAALLVLAVFAAGLLLAAVNLASLFLARALGRRREIATRLALGAARGRVVRQLLIEGGLLALLGGGSGLLLAYAANGRLQRIALPLGGVSWPLDLVLAPRLGAPVLLFALAAAAAATAVFALLPALAATRGELAGVLRESAVAAPPSARRLRSVLLALQVAVSVVLLAATGVALRALRATAAVDPGFEPRGAAAVTLAPELLGYPPQGLVPYFERVERRVAELPGVQATAFASHLPLTAAINLGSVAAAGSDAEAELPVDLAAVGPSYFTTLGVELVAGRAFVADDAAGAPAVVILNQTLARRLWPGTSAVGRRLRDGSEVVGIARDGRYRALGERPRAFLYRPLAQDARGTRTLVVRTAADAGALLPAIRNAAREVDPRVPLGAAATLDDTLAGALFVPRAAAAVLGAFAALGLLLAALGIAWVVAHLAGERRREIGLRLALGAGRGDVLRWLLRRGLLPVGAGLFAGLALALLAGWRLGTMATALRLFDPLALAGALGVLAVVAFAAALVPAWRASCRDPAAVLRAE